MRNALRQAVSISAVLAAVLISTLIIPASPVSGLHVLGIGAEGEQVSLVQAKLAELGFFDLQPTGFYGEITRKSVEEFQRAVDIRVDGMVGLETLASLEIAVGELDHYPLLEIYTRSPEVFYLQLRLASLGYLEVKPTGYFGPLTEEAVRSFQRDRGLAADGVVGSATWHELRKMEVLEQIDAREKELLARLIYAEARGESLEGQVAVGAVVLNRVASPLFPDTIEEVIYQPSQFEPASRAELDGKNEKAFTAARRAVAGEDPSRGAFYFYNPSVLKERGSFERIQWFEAETVPTAEIGTHVFAAPHR